MVSGKVAGLVTDLTHKSKNESMWKVPDSRWAGCLPFVIIFHLPLRWKIPLKTNCVMEVLAGLGIECIPEGCFGRTEPANVYMNKKYKWKFTVQYF